MQTRSGERGSGGVLKFQSMWESRSIQTGNVVGKGSSDLNTSIISTICNLPTTQGPGSIPWSPSQPRFSNFPKHNHTGYKSHSNAQAGTQAYTNLCSTLSCFPFTFSLLPLPLLPLSSYLPFTPFGEVTAQSLVFAVPLAKATFCSLVQVSAGCKT
jgi:hypothetical protein